MVGKVTGRLLKSRSNVAEVVAGVRRLATVTGGTMVGVVEWATEIGWSLVKVGLMNGLTQLVCTVDPGFGPGWFRPSLPGWLNRVEAPSLTL